MLPKNPSILDTRPLQGNACSILSSSHIAEQWSDDKRDFWAGLYWKSSFQMDAPHLGWIPLGRSAVLHFLLFTSQRIKVLLLNLAFTLHTWHITSLESGEQLVQTNSTHVSLLSPARLFFSSVERCCISTKIYVQMFHANEDNNARPKCCRQMSLSLTSACRNYFQLVSIRGAW